MTVSCHYLFLSCSVGALERLRVMIVAFSGQIHLYFYKSVTLLMPSRLWLSNYLFSNTSKCVYWVQRTRKYKSEVRRDVLRPPHSTKQQLQRRILKKKVCKGEKTAFGNNDALSYVRSGPPDYYSLMPFFSADHCEYLCKQCRSR